VASILVYIELQGRVASPRSLAALAVGRSIASGLGGTLYALLPCAAPPSYENDDVITQLSRHGADKVILSVHPETRPLALHLTHGPAVQAACASFQPRLILFPASVGGRDLAPRIAMHLGARYSGEVRLELDGSNHLLVSSAFRGHFSVMERLDSLAGPLVATVVSDREPRPTGDEEAEVVMIHAPPPQESAPRIRGARPFSPEDQAMARVVVAGGMGLQSAEGFALLRKVAAALNGAALASSPACAAGLAGPELGPRGLLRAELYVAFGLAGTEEQLAALPAGASVGAVNTDPAAPIMGAARFGLQADAARTLEELLQVLATGEPT